MNRPPGESIRVSSDRLRDFTSAAFERAGVPADKAAFLADRLVRNDLRGVFSHGSRLAGQYVPLFRSRQINPDPAVTVQQETPTTLVADGDGGLGYFPAHRAAELLGPMAKEMGAAAAVTRNHGHIGAAGIYARIPLALDLFCYVTSGHQLNLQPGQPVVHAAGGSPMAFAIPTGMAPPFVLDFGTMIDLHKGPEHLAEVMERAPSAVLRSFGLGCACQALGGFLAGVPLDPARAERRWPGANQGSFLIAVDLARFGPVEELKREMDAYAEVVRQMKPFPGMESAALPGTPECERERVWSVEGVPVSPRHADALRTLASDLGIEAPV